ncbi:MAG TPA: isoprenylcysteine carboxylmethyltransferase family protein [Thermodesulfobacteriota bacterium]|nr:isoprenylcysteine carboxylmethyltransferase family protein [Thermodesulfobacteriota bacterium]
MSKYTPYVMIGLARFLGGMSLLVFMIFLFVGSLNILDMRLDESGVLWLDAGLSLLFFIQHSGMVRKPFRRWLSRFIPEEYAGAIYAIVSGIVLLFVILLWQVSTQTVMTPSGLFRWSLRAVFLLSLLGFYWGAKALRFFDPFGLKPIFNRLRGRNPKPMPIAVAGPYRWVRHPLYLFIILMFWSCPDLTRDRLLFNLLWTVWIVIGSYFEEIDLVVEFGDPYREYQRNVPMLVPLLKWPKREQSTVNKHHERD